MRIFKNMKVRWKLACGFGLLLVLTLVVGSIAVLRLRDVAVQTRLADKLVNRYSKRVETVNLAVSWAYPVFRESESLITYLRSDNHEEQQSLYQKFQNNGTVFDAIAEEIKQCAVSPEEVRMISVIEKKQKAILRDAAQLVAIRDGEGKYGQKTRAAVEDFQSSIENFISTINDLVTLEGKAMKEIQETSHRISSDVRHGAGKTTTVMIIVSLLAIVIGGGLSFLLSRAIVNPIFLALQTVKKVAVGDLTHSHIDVDTKDEIGEMLRSLNEMTGNLKGILKDVKDTSFALASASEQMSASSVEISRGAEVQSNMSSQVSSASHEMNAAIGEVARNAAGVSDAAKEAEQAAGNGKTIVVRTIDSMNGIAATTRESSQAIETLGNRSKEIEGIIKVIDDIADQTNLLALNAAIEAARAGEQGRGFAVVADEVRKLAEKTTHATKEIGGMVQAIQEGANQSLASMDREAKAVEEGVSLTEEAGAALSLIVTQVGEVRCMIEKIASSSDQQTKAADQISRDIETVAEIAKETSNGSKEIAQAGEEIAKLGSLLQDAVAIFQVCNHDQEKEFEEPETVFPDMSNDIAETGSS